MKYQRNLKDLEKVKKNWYKVFSCFSCWWWSTMWYKNAWYDVIGTCEIDPQMNKVYQQNFWKKINYEVWIQELIKWKIDLSKELFGIDILDWSPPCSNFSTAWTREKGRWKKKKFREWQAEQSLSDLFFDFLDFANIIKPKIIVAENVKWMLVGNAKSYVKEIAKKFNDIWYNMQLFLLNWSTMWLPQVRERVFFIAYRKDLNLQSLKLNFKADPIFYEQIEETNPDPKTYKNIWKVCTELWEKCEPGKSLSSVHPKWSFFTHKKVHPKKVLNTVTAWWGDKMYHYKDKRSLSYLEYSLASSFPLDYNYLDVLPTYLMGMSVPPLMMYKISEQIKIQWLDKL